MQETKPNESTQTADARWACKQKLCAHLPVAQHPPGLALLVVQRQQADTGLLIRCHEEELHPQQLAQLLGDLPGGVYYIGICPIAKESRCEDSSPALQISAYV